jgi:hypothetical protein
MAKKAWNPIWKSHYRQKALRPSQHITSPPFSWTISQGKIAAKLDKLYNLVRKSRKKIMEQQALYFTRKALRQVSLQYFVFTKSLGQKRRQRIHSQAIQEKKAEELWLKYRNLKRRQTQLSCTTNYSRPFSMYYQLPPPPKPPHSPKRTLSCMNLHHLLATNPKSYDYLETTMFGTKGQMAWTLIRKSHNGRKAWNILQRSLQNITYVLPCAMGVHLISRVLQHHFSSTISTFSHSRMGHGSALNLPHASTPPLYHPYITSPSST